MFSHTKASSADDAPHLKCLLQLPKVEGYRSFCTTVVAHALRRGYEGPAAVKPAEKVR